MTSGDGGAAITRARYTALATSLKRPEALSALRRQQQAGRFDAPLATAVAKPCPDSSAAMPVSIWSPYQRDGLALEFVRPPVGPFGDHYADRRSIVAAKPAATRRVCLLGESVAAGYLYAPAVTPAKLLARQLETLGATDVDVIDLARTNERLATLTETAERALQLAPDALIVFAGNNWTLLETPEWSPYATSVRARLAFGAALAEEGLWGPIQGAARAVLERAAAALGRLADIGRDAGIPVILVVPEVDLEGWSNRQPVPWLGGAGVAQWYEAYTRGRAALAAANPASALAAARAMLDLDDGLCPTSFRMLAHAEQLAGDRLAASAARRDEVAASHYASLAFLAAPQASPMAQILLRRAAEQHGFDLVDLPERFRRYVDDAPQGHRLFLDYCHLTAEGMWVAMAAVTRQLGRRLGIDVPTDDAGALERLGPVSVAGEDEARARFGAAIHCSHRLISVTPRRPLLERHCRAALTASPTIAEAMVAFVEARLSGLPAVLSDGQRRLDAADMTIGFQHGWRYDNLDAAVLRAVLAALEAADPAAHGEALGALGRAGIARSVDLLADDRYLAEPLERFFPELLRRGDRPQHALYRAAWPETRFALPLRGAGCLELEITARLPCQNGLPAPTAGTLLVKVEGLTVARLAVGDRFSRHRVRLSASVLRAGLNEIALAWPVPPEDGRAALEAAATRLERGVEADLHPVWGELFAMTCRPAS